MQPETLQAQHAAGVERVQRSLAAYQAQLGKAVELVAARAAQVRTMRTSPSLL